MEIRPESVQKLKHGVGGDHRAQHWKTQKPTPRKVDEESVGGKEVSHKDRLLDSGDQEAMGSSEPVEAESQSPEAKGTDDGSVRREELRGLGAGQLGGGGGQDRDIGSAVDEEVPARAAIPKKER